MQPGGTLLPMDSRTEHLREDWNEPSAYERWYTSPLGQAYLACIQRILIPWIAEVPRTKALDIGCGPGLVAERLFPDDSRVVGADCSFEMARRAKARARSGGRSLFAVAGSVEALPFRSEQFQVALCVNCLEFVENPAEAFREIARVLVPSGVAIIGVLNRRSLWEFARRLRRPFSRRSYYRGSFFKMEHLRSQIHAAGLAVQEARTIVHFPPVSSFLLRSLYQRVEAIGQRVSPARGAVILCRAVKNPSYL